MKQQNVKLIAIIIGATLAVIPTSMLLYVYADVRGLTNPLLSAGVGLTLMFSFAFIVDRHDRRKAAKQPSTLLAQQIDAEKERKRKWLHTRTTPAAASRDIETTTDAITADTLARTAGRIVVMRPVPHLCSGDENCRTCTGPQHRGGTPVQELLARQEQARKDERERSRRLMVVRDEGEAPIDADQG